MVTETTKRTLPRGMALFNYGFRPFFLLAALQAAVAIPVWLLVFQGRMTLPVPFPPSIWHSHEMLYGFGAATLGGFFLTAVPNWTGARPVRGAMLAGLVGLWLAGRVLFWDPALAPAWLVAVVDLAFLPALAATVGPALLAPAAKRQRAFLLVLAVLFGGNLLVHLSRFGIAWADPHKGALLAIDVFVLLITMVGGRIVPSFTANAARAADPASALSPSPLAERFAPVATALLIPVDLVLGTGPSLAVVALAAAALQAARLWGWRSRAALKQPILWVLHLGYAWLPIGLALRGVGAFTDAIPATAGLHALTVGAIGTMTLAVMSRAGLGHTGRALEAAPLTVAAYGLVTLAAIMRVLGAIFVVDLYPLTLELSGCAWSVGFVLFLVVYAPILTRPRADGRPG